MSAGAVNGTTGQARLGGIGPARHLTLLLLSGIPGLAHAFTVTGSDEEAVLEAVTGRRAPLFLLRQVHGRLVHRVEPDATPAPPGHRPAADALTTSRRDVALGVRVADCVPILLVDPVSGATAAVHAGWRGTVAGVLPAAIRDLAVLGAKTRDLRIGLGPSIGPCCFQVGDEVVAEFHRADPQASSSIMAGTPARIDLIHANRLQAIACGVREDRIAAAGLCTVCRGDLLESYRRSRGSPGRMSALIAWRAGSTP
jgi:YfiH family protein